MQQITRRYKAQANENLTITHLGGLNPPNVYESREMLVDGHDGVIIIQGRVNRDGYLPVHIAVGSRKVYPTDRARAVGARVMLSIEVSGLDMRNVVEIFECSDRDKDRILYKRWTWAYRHSMNQSTRDAYALRLNELKDKWRDAG